LSRRIDNGRHSNRRYRRKFRTGTFRCRCTQDCSAPASQELRFTQYAVIEFKTKITV